MAVVISLQTLYERAQAREREFVGLPVIGAIQFMLRIPDEDLPALRDVVSTALAHIGEKDPLHEDQIISAFAAGALMGSLAEQIQREEVVDDGHGC